MFLLVGFTLLVIYVISYYLWVSKYPKGPLPLPLFGNMFQVPLENAHLYVENLAKTYGPVFTIFLPRPHVVLADFAHIKEALVGQREGCLRVGMKKIEADTFIGRSLLPPETLFQRETQMGLLMSDGEVWREQRRISLQILRNFGMGKNLMEQQVG